MYGKKSRGSKNLATRGRGDFVKFYLAPPPPPPKMRVAPQMPPPQIPRLGAATVSGHYLGRVSFSALQLNTNRSIQAMTLIAFINENFARRTHVKYTVALRFLSMLLLHTLLGVGAVTMSRGHCPGSTNHSGPFNQT